MTTLLLLLACILVHVPPSRGRFDSLIPPVADPFLPPGFGGPQPTPVQTTDPTPEVTSTSTSSFVSTPDIKIVGTSNMASVSRTSTTPSALPTTSPSPSLSPSASSSSPPSGPPSISSSAPLSFLDAGGATTYDATKVGSLSAPSMTTASSETHNGSIFPAPSLSAPNYPATTSPSRSRSSGISTGGIVGIVFSVLALIAIGILWWWRMRRTVNVNEPAFESGLARTYPFPYMVHAFLTSRSREGMSKKRRNATGLSQPQIQEEPSTITIPSLSELTLVMSASGYTDSLVSEHLLQKELSQAQDSRSSEVLPEITQPESTPPEIRLTIGTVNSFARPPSITPRPSSPRPLPILYSSSNVIQRRRHTDGGVRLAGGRPGESREESEEDADDSSSLPPEYGDY